MSGTFDGGGCRLAVSLCVRYYFFFFLFVERLVALMRSDTNVILDVQVLFRISLYCFYICCGRY